MTAEVVILNKSAVALAADSTVTIDAGDASGKRKTYNTVNKLFTLSKYQPVGAMIFGDANFMGVPWETIIKDYRKAIGSTSYDTVREYMAGFVAFLENASYLQSQQEWTVWITAYRFFIRIASVVSQKVVCDPLAADDGPSPIDTTATADALIKEWEDRISSADLLAVVDEAYVESLASKYEMQFRESRDEAFNGKGIVLSDYAITTLPSLAARAIASGLIRAESGLVIAGFGDSQIFPSVVTITPLLLANGRFLFKVDEGKSYDVSHDNDSALIPFAQQDVVTTFLDGIDPQYHDLIESTISKLFEDYPAVVADHLSLDAATREPLIKQVKDKTARLKEELFEAIAEYKKKTHTSPLLNVIGVLPKDELAATAESLVSLTAIKRKMSLEIETVGGPIDVAVISKGDGFIWIKRKHYFDPALNPMFTETYFQR